MFNALFDFILKIFFWLASLISSLIFVPIFGLFSVIIPDFSGFLGETLTFWNRIIRGACFFKEVFINITGFPRTLFNLIIVFFFSRLAIMVSLRLIRFIYNMYLLIRGSKQ